MSLRSFLLALVAAVSLIAPAGAVATASPPVVLARAGIGTSHFGGGRGVSRPSYGYRRRGFGHGFFLFGGGGLGFFPVLLVILLIFLLSRSGRRRR
jgi:hypothetical protein